MIYELYDTGFKQAHPKLRFASLIVHQQDLPKTQFMCEFASMHNAEKEI
jgi:hypothetical protein